MLTDNIRESGANIQHSLRQANSITRDCHRLGLVHVHLIRADALNNFSTYIQDEIARAEQGQPALL